MSGPAAALVVRAVLEAGAPCPTERRGPPWARRGGVRPLRPVLGSPRAGEPMRPESSELRLEVPRGLARAVSLAALALVAAPALGAGQARAQDAAPAPARSDSVTVAPSLRYAVGNAGWLRVSGPWGRARLRAPRVVGAALGFEEARPEAGSATAEVPNPLPLARIDLVQVPVGSSRNGAIVGGMVGVILGVATASALSNMDVLGPAPGPSAGDLLAGALVGGVPGACLGAVLGTAFTRWKTIYPEPWRAPERSWDSRSRGGERPRP